MLVQNRQNRNGLFGAIRNYCDLLYLFMFLLPGEKFTEKIEKLEIFFERGILLEQKHKHYLCSLEKQSH